MIYLCTPDVIVFNFTHLVTFTIITSEERWLRGRAWFNLTYSHFETYAISFTPHLPVSFGRDTKSRWSLISGVYARGSKRSHPGGKCVTCSGLTNSRWTLNALPRALSSTREKRRRRMVMLDWRVTVWMTACVSVIDVTIACLCSTDQSVGALSLNRHVTYISMALEFIKM